MLNVDVLVQLDVAEKKLAELIKAKQEADANYDAAFTQYCHSADGSEAQERRRDAHLERLQETIGAASSDVYAQQQLVDDLRDQLQI